DCKLFHNEGEGRFTDATQAAGIAIDSYAMGCCAGDYDNDGFVDLFVSGFGRSTLLHNERGSDGRRVFRDVTRRAGLRQRPGQWTAGSSTGERRRLRFKNVGLVSGVAYGEAGTMRAGMGADAGDFDGDGRLDLVITNFQHEPNSLYRNTGARTFTEVTYPSGIGTPSVLKLGFGVAFLDVDGDGRLDLYAGNGHVFDNVA